jgi:hypothetical protein
MCYVNDVQEENIPHHHFLSKDAFSSRTLPEGRSVCCVAFLLLFVGILRQGVLCCI